MSLEAIRLFGTQEGKELYESVKHLKGDILSLRKDTRFRDLDVSVLGFFIDLFFAREKAQEKFAKGQDMLFTKRGYEQSTSEQIAEYKATWTGADGRVLVLCSGIGGELIQLAKQAKEVVAVDSDPVMIACAQWNAKVYGVEKNISFVCTTVEEYLDTHSEKFDAIYIDPDRRDGQSRKVAIDEYTPSLFAIHDQLLQRSEHVHIKVSPMLSKKELAELMEDFFIEFLQEGPTLKECVLHTCPIAGETKQSPYVATYIAEEEIRHLLSSENDGAAFAEEGVHYKYLFEPYACVLRAGLVQDIAERVGGFLLAPGGGLQFVEEVVDLALQWGEVYEIMEVLPFGVKQLKLYIKEHNVKEAIIKLRHFPMTQEEIVKKLKLPETGETIFYFTTVGTKKVVVVCKRL